MTDAQYDRAMAGGAYVDSAEQPKPSLRPYPEDTTGYEWDEKALGVRYERCDGCGFVRPVKRRGGRRLCKPCTEEGIK